MQFKNIIGQSAIINRLLKSVNENRISHALLLTGPEGSGNLAIAMAYAQYISCENRQPEDSCGTCRSCVKYNKLVHPDLHFVFPVVNSDKNPKAVSDNYLVEWRKALLENPYMNLNSWVQLISAENKQGGIFERESDEIIRKLSLKSYESEYKIMIIWMPEKMNAQTSNKLLKLLEEPPQNTIFLLVSENTGMMLTTILSRCQLMKIPSIAETDLFESLGNLGVSEDKKAHIARLANGNYLKALELIENHVDDQYMLDLFIRLTRICYKGDVQSIIAWVDEVASIGREKQKYFLVNSLRLIRENFTLNVANSNLVYLNEAENNFSQKFHPFINERNTFQLKDEFNKAHYHIESNANPKILFLDLSLKLIMLIKK